MSADTFRFSSPLGEMSYIWDGECCRELSLLDVRVESPVNDDPVSRWLHAYFSGGMLPLPPLAAPRSPFQARMRQALLATVPGRILTYGEMARQLGTAPRAMGQALGANPLPVLIPCHRVLASGGGLGGRRCGLEWKRLLLDFESGLQGK